MKRVVAVAALLGVAAVAVLLATGGGGEDERYRVRAIFLNAFGVVPGIDVRVAGVRVGQVVDTRVTREKRAAIVMDIDDAGFQDFRQDAECAVRPQSLIGEKFVECSLTQPRPEGAGPADPLRRVGDERVLGVEGTSRPVDIDLLNEAVRLPQRQRLAIILNELGAGLAARGPELARAVRNADPALKETDRVVALLAAQDRTLRELATQGAEALEPLARDREQVARFVAGAAEVSEATAARQADLQEGLARLPGFLRELRPTMTRLGALSAEGRPVLADLRAAAPDLASLVGDLGPFSREGTPALRRLGQASQVGRRALVASRPRIRQLADLAGTARPVAGDLRDALVSLRRTGGIEQAMAFIFNQAGSVNGFDANGHFLRANLIINNCSTYATTPQPGCSANFTTTRSTGPSAASAGTPRAAAAGAPASRQEAELLERAVAGTEDEGEGTDPATAEPLLDLLLGGGGR